MDFWYEVAAHRKSQGSSHLPERPNFTEAARNNLV